MDLLNFPKSKKYRHLFFDLVHEILLRLPVKTLIKCKCVCKSWHSLICHPPFQEEHYFRSKQRPLLLITQNNFEVSRINKLSFSTYNIRDGVTLLNNFTKASYHWHPAPSFYPIQSCHGLVCIISERDRFSKFDPLTILLCNPSTEEVIMLPPPPPPPTERIDYVVGFGYATSTQEFKLVRFCMEILNISLTYCETYTLGTSHGWRETRPPPVSYCRDSGAAPFLHGAFHLLPHYRYKLEEGYYYISAFDIETEVYREIPVPQCYPDDILQCVYLKELSGSLCLSFNYPTSEKQLELWILKNYDIGDWVKEYNIDIFTQIYGAIYAWPLAIIGEGIILLHVGKRDDLYGLSDWHQWYELHDMGGWYELHTLYELQLNNLREREFMKEKGNKYYSGMLYVESFSGMGTRLSSFLNP